MKVPETYLDFPQVFEIMECLDNGINTGCKISRHLLVTASTVSNHICALNNEGLIKRTNDPKYRAATLELTDKGKIIMDSIRKIKKLVRDTQ